MDLLLVDDHTLFREGLRALLANISPELTVHETASVASAIDACTSTAFHMVLLDLGLANSGGVETLDAFRQAVPDIPVVVLSGDQQPRLIRSAIDRGAVGYIPKSHTSELMIAALRLVIAGGIYLPPIMIDQPGMEVTANADSFMRLSARQQEVIQLLLQGRSNKEIARKLQISEGTVKAHVSTIFQIIGVKNRVEAVTLAAKEGIRVR